MAAPEVTQLDWDARLLEAFGPSVAASPWGWGTPLEVLGGSHAFEVGAGPRRALVALRPVERQDGVRLDLVGLVSLGDRLQALEFGAGLDRIARTFGARAVAMSTLRPHVARAARRIGFNDAGVLMMKACP